MFGPADWEAAGQDPTAFAEAELKRTLEGLAKHLFGGWGARCWNDGTGWLLRGGLRGPCPEPRVCPPRMPHPSLSDLARTRPSWGPPLVP